MQRVSLIDQRRLPYNDQFQAHSGRNDMKWDLMYKLMLKYGEEHNSNCNVPTKYTTHTDDGNIL